MSSFAEILRYAQNANSKDSNERRRVMSKILCGIMLGLVCSLIQAEPLQIIVRFKPPYTQQYRRWYVFMTIIIV